MLGSAYVFLGNESPSCTAVSAAPGTILPATRDQMKLITLSGATDPDADTLSYHIDGVTRTSPSPVAGSATTPAPTPPLAQGANSNQLLVRAERNPMGNGRVYRIAYSVSDTKGGSHSGTAGPGGNTTAKVAVPRKKGETAIDGDDTASWDSFTGAPVPQSPTNTPGDG
jgi:hypothetical protein